MSFGACLGGCLEVSGMSVGSEPMSSSEMFEPLGFASFESTGALA